LNSLKPAYKKSKEARSKNIEALIEQLTRATLGENGNEKEPEQPPKPKWGALNLFSFFPGPKPSHSYGYDPNECLFGNNFYCTLYFYYPNIPADGTPPEDPIWEQTSLTPSNIKGQQYYIRDEDDGTKQLSVLNYSEVWGPGFFITAAGVLASIDDENNDNSNDARTKRTPRRLPDVYRVDATKISVSLFGKCLDVEIEGSANLVVLYADPRLRIFVSPLASETVVGNWEQAGLVVVQVRGDLVPAKDNQTQQITDLIQ